MSSPQERGRRDGEVPQSLELRRVGIPGIPPTAGSRAKHGADWPITPKGSLTDPSPWQHSGVRRILSIRSKADRGSAGDEGEPGGTASLSTTVDVGGIGFCWRGVLGTRTEDEGQFPSEPSADTRAGKPTEG